MNEDTKWFRVTLLCSPSESEAAWAILYRYDCVGLEEIEAGAYHAYFSVGADPERVLARLLGCSFVHSAKVCRVESQDWHARWKESYRSFRVGQFFIRPSWEKDRPAPGLTEIVMDPKAAFGTGTHATTQLCLQHLPSLLAQSRTVIDVGCGSGILAIAARKTFPASGVVALDNDLEACRVCRDNAVINGVSLDVVCGTLSCTRQAFDCMVANLQLDILLGLEPEFYSRTPRGARLLLSGVLQEQVGELRRCYDFHFHLEAVHSQDEWVAAVYRRR